MAVRDVAGHGKVSDFVDGAYRVFPTERKL